MGVTMREGLEKVSWDIFQFDKMIEAGILVHKHGGVVGGDGVFEAIPNTFYTELIEGEIVRNIRKVRQGEQEALNEEEREQAIQPFRAMFGDKYHILLKHPFSVGFKSTVMPRLMVSLEEKPTVTNDKGSDIVVSREGRFEGWSQSGARKEQRYSSNIMLAMEFSTDTLSFGKVTKAELYAHAGIPEYWIYRMQDRSLEVHSNPDKMKERYLGHGYRSVHQYSHLNSVSPYNAPEKAILISDVVQRELADRLW